MSGSLKALSVKQKILNATHDSALDRPGWELAHFLLLHYDELDRLKARDIAESCHISLSTVRRFCQSLGYDNLSDLQRAKTGNPENQYEIAVANCRAGLFQPRRMYDEIAGALWSLGQKTDWNELDRLAAAMTNASAVLVYALRPYTFVLHEFQSQFVSLGRQLYVFDGISAALPVISRLDTAPCHVALSPAGVFIPAIDADLAALEGFKAVVYCPKTLAAAGGESCLARYDARFPLTFRTQEYNYLEVFGKYAVMCFLDVLLGRVVERLGAKELN